MTSTVAQPDPNFHIYLAFGQSNMEGQGPIEEQDKVPVERFKVLSTSEKCMGREVGQWYDAIPPLANRFGVLGPCDYFGRTLVKKLPENIKVGVVVVAVAGADIQLFEEENYTTYEQPDWMQERSDSYGGNPFRRLVEMGKKAQEAGVIKGILLHQGETNEGQLEWLNRVKAVYEKLLSELNLRAEEVPLLVGEVVSAEVDGQCAAHNKVIQKMPEVIPTAHVISSKGLDHQGDHLHFSTAAYRQLGERYAEEMLKFYKL
ncbi:carbohydrate esterase family 6 protein [Piromyces sp. E2]|nr:carbohydrate esterase family 6 protein [Piromyces sp. E2]|eukprot:OUM64013.1 carbohydrate esterase family 6 protein [Piromyces sp. E2]